MKAVTVDATRRTVSLVDVPEPPSSLAPTEVQLRVLEVGVCGTDREICCFDYGTPPPGSDHLVIGHECLAEVVAVGSDVERVRAGDLVVPTVRRPCPHDDCSACGVQRQDFCFTGDFVERGIKQAHGYMTEFVVDDQRYMNVLPNALRDVGVLVEPLTIAEKALEQVWQVQRRLPWGCPDAMDGNDGYRHRAVVLGAGPVGLLGAMALRANGFDTFVYSREARGSAKATLVESFGAHYLSAVDVPLDSLARRVGSIDLIYEAAGASGMAFGAMGQLGTNGIFVFTGVPGRKGPMPVDTDALMRGLVLRNQVVFGTVNAGLDCFAAAVRDLQVFERQWPAALRALITARQPVDGYRSLLLDQPQGIKNVLTFA